MAVMEQLSISGNSKSLCLPPSLTTCAPVGRSALSPVSTTPAAMVTLGARTRFISLETRPINMSRRSLMLAVSLSPMTTISRSLCSVLVACRLARARATASPSTCQLTLRSSTSRILSKCTSSPSRPFSCLVRPTSAHSSASSKSSSSLS